MDEEVLGNLLGISAIIIYLFGNFVGIVCATLVTERLAEFLDDGKRFRENIFYKITQYIIKSYYQMRIDAKQFSWTLYFILVPLINIPVFIFVVYLFVMRKKVNNG